MSDRCSRGCCWCRQALDHKQDRLRLAWLHQLAANRLEVSFCPATGERLDFDAQGNPRVTPGVWGEVVGELVAGPDPLRGAHPRRLVVEVEALPNNLASIVGKWPGDETDEEIEQALAELRGEDSHA